jgi:hypothetical protein
LSTFAPEQEARYSLFLEAARAAFPGAEILEPKFMFDSSDAWRAAWRGILESLDVLVFFTDANGMIGPGVAVEVRDAIRAGIDVFGMTNEPKPRLSEDFRFAVLPAPSASAVATASFDDGK